jgi:hypothetical protein
VNQRGLIGSTFSTVLNDLNQTAEEISNERITYEEAFAKACSTQIINEESLNLAVDTLMQNVLRLKGKLDLETMVETSKEQALDLSPSECKKLLQHYKAKRRAARRE